MAINPFQLMQFQEMLTSFRQNHPKFPMFLQAVKKNALTEGTIIELSVKTPDEKNYCTNLRLTASDVELLQKLLQSHDAQ